MMSEISDSVSYDALQAEVIAALDILVTERVEPFSFQLIASAPEFAVRLFFPPGLNTTARLNFGGSAFLLHFLEEAELFWLDGVKKHLESGPWIEVDGEETEYALQAIALNVKCRKILVVKLLGVDFQERKRLLQSAREKLLAQRHLEALVAERTRELSLAQEVTVESLAALAETRDPETGTHIHRTQQYVRLLAEHLHHHSAFSWYLDNETIELLYKAAPLHDIGKVGVPDGILLKPGRLSEEEFERMKMHVEYGHNAILNAERKLGGNSFLRTAREIVYTHHEKWDGSGYPRGLKGEEIPISGRLMALADVYDSLVNDRVYRAAFPHEYAVRYIVEGKGVHFDPHLVEAFLELEDEFKEIARAHVDNEKGLKSLSSEE
jgi:response regulator RpfG family c-di-GMP phosphodiesterase